MRDLPLWFSGGQTCLLPEPGEFAKDNQRPITCLNTVYEWCTSCLPVDVNHHLLSYDLMQGDQRRAKQNCSGTVDNLLIDRMVCQGPQRGHRNLSMAWIDVSKAYDSVDHRWLVEMFKPHRFPEWFCVLIGKLSRSWNTRIVTETKQGYESPEIIHFKKGLPQGDSLCPTLFTLCLNPLAWKLRATSGYKLSKSISFKVTHLLYIDDLKMYASSESNLERVIRTVKGGMDYNGLKWNEKKCAVVHMKRGCIKQTVNMEIDELKSIKSLGEEITYKFLGGTRAPATTFVLP